MSKRYRSYAPGQGDLLPPSPREWLPADHLSYFVLDVVGQLDLGRITARYQESRLGQPPYDPRMMAALLIYGYAVGVRSSRQIERRTHEDIAFRMLAAGQHPDHSRISGFRQRHLEALGELFAQVLRLCRQAGLVRLGQVSLDGTKMKANASKHKAMSHQRMKDEEARLGAEVARMLAEAGATDAEEDARYGKDKRGDELPEALRDPATRLARIRELRDQLEAEARTQREAKADDDSDDDDGPPVTDLPSHQVPTSADGTPTPKAQRNFTDGDSRIMKTDNGFMQAYNAQIVVDDAHQIIVAHAVTNQPPDAEHLVPMLEQTALACGVMPATLLADAGYCSESNIVYALNQGTDAYIATGRQKHGAPAPTVRGRPPRDQTLREAMARKLATKAGAAAYRRRKATVEPVFGQIKGARGIRDFLLRGLGRVRGEWSLIAMTHNLLKLWRAARGPRRVALAAG